MPTDPLHDSIRPIAIVAEPDAHGQAALVLAESLLHALVEAMVLTNAEAIEVVQRAVDVKREVATAAGESVGRMQQSLDLLSRMTASFGADELKPRNAIQPHVSPLA